jgi:hypothetical protein
MVDVAAFETIYPGLQDSLRTAERDVSGLVAQAISQIGNPFLVRSTVDSTRVKALRSVVKKCERKGLRPDEIIGLSDLVGIRVVCANLEDVERLVELVKGISAIEVTAIQKKKTADGYRAVHVDMRYPVEANGRMVWNRLRYVKNPDTGKRVSRLNPSSEWIAIDVPHLRSFRTNCGRPPRTGRTTRAMRSRRPAISRRRTVLAICSPD